MTFYGFGDFFKLPISTLFWSKREKLDLKVNYTFSFWPVAATFDFLGIIRDFLVASISSSGHLQKIENRKFLQIFEKKSDVQKLTKVCHIRL